MCPWTLVVAGSTFVSFFLSLSFLPPLAPFPRARRVYKQTRLLQQVFLMRFGLSSVCPRSFGSPFIGPHRRSSFFSFMSFCLHVSSSSSFLSLARTIVRTLVCTHTRTRTLLTTGFRWPRFVTMRFGSSVVPLHVVFLHRQPHTPLSVSVFSFSSVPFACTCALPPFRAGWRPHMPPFGEACVCTPWNQTKPIGLEQGRTARHTHRTQ